MKCVNLLIGIILTQYLHIVSGGWIPPSRGIDAIVRVGTTQNLGSLSFTPYNSKVPMNHTGAFEVDVEGDFVGDEGFITAVDEDVWAANFFEGFRGVHNESKGVCSGESRYNAWLLSGAVHIEGNWASMQLGSVISTFAPANPFAGMYELNVVLEAGSDDHDVEVGWYFGSTISLTTTFDAAGRELGVWWQGSGEGRKIGQWVNVDCLSGVISLWSNQTHAESRLVCSGGKEYATGFAAHGIDYRTLNVSDVKADIILIGHGSRMTNVSLTPHIPPPHLPALLTPIPNAGVPSSAVLGNLTPSAYGVLDATLPPFSIDNTGASDVTALLQAAIDFAKQHYLTLYLPAGDYLVSDTLSIVNTEREDALSPPPPNFWQGSRYAGLAIVGNGKSGARTRIVLHPSSPGFTKVSDPKPVLWYWMENAKGQSQPNANANGILQSVDVSIGDGNVGAIGVRMRGAQGMTLQDVTVDAGDGYAGVSGGAGSGGAHHSVRVIGGLFSADLSEAQPGPTFSGLTALNPKCAGLYYAGLQTLTLVGFNFTINSQSSSSAIPIATGWPLRSDLSCTPVLFPSPELCEGNYQCSQLSLIDGSIDRTITPSSHNSAIIAAATVFIQNVYVRGFDKVVQFDDGISLAASTTQPVTRIGTYVHAPQLSFPDNPQFSIHTYINGTSTSKPTISRNITSTTTIPTTLVSKHSFLGLDLQTLPSFQIPGALNASTFGAVGDGVADDTGALQAALDAAVSSSPHVVFLPKGVYRVSRTISIPQGVSLVGIALHLTSIVPSTTPLAPNTSLDSPSLGTPILRSLPPTSTALSTPTILARLTVTTFSHFSNISAIEWMGRGLVFQVHTNRLVECGIANGSPLLQSSSSIVPPCQPQASMRVPLATVRGGSVAWYTFYCEDAMNSQTQGTPPQAPPYRHLLVSNSPDFQGYHVNPEHASSEASSQIDSSSNVNFFGVKSEGEMPPVWISNSSNVLITGHGGNALPLPHTAHYPSGFSQFTPSLYRLEKNTGPITLANLVRFYHPTNAKKARDILILVSQSTSGHNASSALLQRVAYWEE